MLCLFVELQMNEQNGKDLRLTKPLTETAVQIRWCGINATSCSIVSSLSQKITVMLRPMNSDNWKQIILVNQIYTQMFYKLEKKTDGIYQRI